MREVRTFNSDTQKWLIEKVSRVNVKVDRRRNAERRVKSRQNIWHSQLGPLPLITSFIKIPSNTCLCRCDDTTTAANISPLPLPNLFRKAPKRQQIVIRSARKYLSVEYAWDGRRECGLFFRGSFGSSTPKDERVEGRTNDRRPCVRPLTAGTLLSISSSSFWTDQSPALVPRRCGSCKSSVLSGPIVMQMRVHVPRRKTLISTLRAHPRRECRVLGHIPLLPPDTC